MFSARGRFSARLSAVGIFFARKEAATEDNALSSRSRSHVHISLIGAGRFEGVSDEAHTGERFSIRTITFLLS